MLKYIDELRTGSSRDVHAGRMLEDGMPYRGPALPLRPEEFEEITDVVYDTEVRLFDLSVTEQRREYSEVIERAVSGWYQIHSRIEKMVEQKDGSVKVFAYCIWSIPYRQPDTQRLQRIVGSAATGR